MKSGKALLGILAGIATGSILGILFAPEKGKVTRKRIAKKGEDYAGAAKGKFDELSGDVTDRYKSAKEGITDFARHAKAKVNKEIKSLKKTPGA
jgi:gas vesicle protein